MELANQTLYFSVLMILLGLMAGFFARHEASGGSSRQFIIWPLGITFYAISFAAFLIATWGSKTSLAVANISLVGGSICIAVLFRSWLSRIDWFRRIFALILFAISTTAYLYLLKLGTTSDRIHLMNAVLSMVAIWQMIELVLLNRERPNLYQIKILIGVQLLQVVVRLARSGYMYDNLSVGPSTLYQEDVIGFSLRAISILLIIITCVLITNYYLENLWKEHRDNAKAIEDGMLQSLNALSLVRDNETGNHILRTQLYVKRLAEKLREQGFYLSELSDDAISNMEKAAPLHDIGKVGIPDDILKKNGKLTPDEWKVMQTHAALGERVLKAAKLEDAKHAKVLDIAIQIAGAHHENWDGSGYPRALKGGNIPLAARIMALADMYDALVSERVYKQRWSHEDACKEILKNRGIRFDPAIVDVFILEQENFRSIAARLDDSKSASAP